VYKLFNHDTGYYYIGVRCANKVNASDDTLYMGSSKNSILKEYIFEKQIIAEFFDKKHAAKFETEMIMSCRKDPLCLNKAAWPHYTMSGKDPWNKGTKGLQKQSPETLAKRFSPEARKKMSLAKKGKPSLNPWPKGKPTSPESNIKRSNAVKGRPKYKCSCAICHMEITGHSLWRHYKARHQ
jgi:hypothetical protein